MSNPQELEIIRFDERGESVRRVRCLANRITVLRSANPNLLSSYRDALLGNQQKTRFSIILDGKSFVPKEHCWIGVKGSQSQTNIHTSVRDCLTNAGISDADVEQTMVDHGLGGLGSSSVATLAIPQQAMIAMLSATVIANRVLILEDPFSSIDPPWREKIAETLIRFVKEKRGVVVVTGLELRPQAWIENEYVARIQLERPRQATVGFGGQDQSTEMVGAVRAEYKALSAAIPITEAQRALIPEPKRNREILAARQPLTPIVLASIVGLVAGVVVLGSQALENDFLMIQSPPTSVAMPQTGWQDIPTTASALTKVSPVDVMETGKRSPEHLTLDSYPALIKEAVLMSFEHPDEALREVSFVNESAQAHPLVSEKIDFVSGPNSMSASAGVNIPDRDDSENSPLSEDEINQRREEIRRRFIEALARERADE